MELSYQSIAGDAATDPCIFLCADGKQTEFCVQDATEYGGGYVLTHVEYDEYGPYAWTQLGVYGNCEAALGAMVLTYLSPRH